MVLTPSTPDIGSPESRTLVAIFEGPAVERGRVSVPEFVRVLDGIQRSLIIVGQELMGRHRTRGPVPQTYIQQLTLQLVATEAGSFKATLELPHMDRPPLLDVGEEALDRILEGIQAEYSNNVARILPISARTIIQETVFKAVGQDTRLTLRGGRGRREVVLTPERVGQPQAIELSTPTRGRSRLVGRVLEVDFKDKTAEVWDASGKMTRVRFPEELADTLQTVARMQIVIDGDAETDDLGRTRSFDIKEVATIDIKDDFWKNPSLEELVRQQNVKPLGSASDLAAPSFADEDVDALIADIRALRSN
jgi:hypothetical protein